MARFNTQSIDAPRWAPLQPSRVELPRQNMVSAYLLRLTGILSIVGGTGVGKYIDNGIWRLLRHVQFRVAGRDAMSFTGAFLYLYLYLYGTEARVQTEPGAVAKDTDYPLELWADIPLSMMHSQNPDEFGAPTSILPSPEIVVTWGNGGDMVKGSDGDAVLKDMDVQLYEVSHDQTPRDPRSFRPLLISQYEREVNASGAVSLQLAELVAGDEIRAVFIEALGGGAAGTGYEYEDGLIETVRLKASGRAVRETVPFALVQQDNVVDYRLDTGIMPGLAVLDAAPTGQTGAGQLWTVEGHTTPTLELQVKKMAGDCKIRATVVYARGRLAAR